MFDNKFKKLDPVAEAIKSIAEADYKTKMEELKGGQYKLDKNKNGKLDSQDFKMLRKEEDELEEGVLDKVKGGVKKIANLIAPDDETLMKDLARKTGVKDKESEKDNSENAKKDMKEATDTKQVDPKTGKVVSWKHEGDWKKNDKKNPEGKVHNLAGQALKKSKELAKEEAVEEGWDDMIKASRKSAEDQKAKTLTRTGHEVKKTSTGTVYTKTYNKKTGLAEDEKIQERELTPDEALERERLVKGMKKSLAGFKARYGDRAKSVMYATATKQAKDKE